MEIATIDHQGLKDFVTSNNAKGLKQDQVSRLRNILAALISASSMAEVEGPPGWRIHQLKGTRAGQWSISVSGNWRLTFMVEAAVITHLNLEDYH